MMSNSANHIAMKIEPLDHHQVVDNLSITLFNGLIAWPCEGE